MKRDWSTELTSLNDNISIVKRKERRLINIKRSADRKIHYDES